MANSVDLVIGSEAIKQVENLISKLSLADAELLKISQSATTASKGITGISTPSGLDKAVTNTANLNAQLEKQNAIITKLHADIAKKAEQSRLAEIQLQKAREKAFDSYSSKLAKQEAAELAKSNKVIAQKEKEFAIFEKQFQKYEADLAKQAIAEEKASQKAIQAANKQQLAEEKQALARRTAFDKNSQKLANETAKELSAYNRIQTSVTLLTKTYNDLAIRKQLGNTLSANEEKQLTSLSSRINTYQSALLKVDSQIGKNQRNVGNYASGFNALGNSINQLSREAPAFANSVNTGFMALSNNFPALFDAINGIRTQNKALAAEGKPTVSVLKSIAGAVFGWQTLLSIGVTLLTLYGGKIVEWVGSLSKGSGGLKTLAENQAELNDALNEGSGRYAEEKVNIDVLYKTATDLNNSYKDRKKAVDDLQEQYPFYFKNLSDETIMAGDAEKQYNLLSEAILTTAKARAAEGILQEREKERLEIEQDNLIKIDNLYKELARTKNSKDFVSDEGGGIYTAKGKESIKRDILDIRKESVRLREQWAKEDAFFIKKVAEGNAIKDTLKPEGNVKKKAAQAKAKREDLDYLQSYVKPVGTVVDEINKEIDRLTTEKIIANETELPAINEQLRLLLELKKQLNAVPTGGALPEGFATPQIPTEQMNKLKDDWKDTFNEIADSAQKAGEIIAGFSEMNFKNEYARLEAQKDISLKFAGDSAAAKQKIEEDYEKKRKEIANRENKAKQRQALFNIAIDTAQAVVEALPNIPLAIAMGVFGAAQAVLVASQKVPEYFAGTDNHQGGLMLVNDGGGSNYQEKVILPNGKEVIPEGRNVLMNAPKGTKVLTHEQQIREMLNERGISMSKSYQSNGMTAEEMDMVTSKHFSRIRVNNTSFDKNGFSSWSEKNGNRTKQNANRVSRTGFRV